MASEKGCRPREDERSSKPAEQKDDTESLSRLQEKVTTSNLSSGYRFCKSMRLLRRPDFLRIQSTGEKLYSKQFLILYTPGKTSCSRLGIVITKKVDKRAVVRNSIKRRLREAFRLNYAKIGDPFDFVIIARKNAGACSYTEIERQMIGALRHGGLLS